MKIAFYAPMKSPNHPVPSGDRRIARLLLRALERAGHAPELVSELRLRDGVGDARAQCELITAAETEVSRLIARLRADPPALWFTYHCYYKAPDLIGPVVSAGLGIPYVIAEGSRSRKRLDGPWAGFARRSEAAIDAAALLFVLSPRDRPALEADAREGQRIADLPPFIDPGPEPMARERAGRLRLLTVAMMRAGAKLRSYAALAEALTHLDGEWRLDIVGDGPERESVEALFASFGARVRFLGEIADEPRLRALYEAADVFVWPGIEEAWGMVYLEAQAAGAPVVAEAHPGPASVIAPGAGLIAPGGGRAFAHAIHAVAAAPDARRNARAHICARHSLDAAARRLSFELETLQ